MNNYYGRHSKNLYTPWASTWSPDCLPNSGSGFNNSKKFVEESSSRNHPRSHIPFQSTVIEGKRLIGELDAMSIEEQREASEFWGERDKNWKETEEEKFRNFRSKQFEKPLDKFYRNFSFEQQNSFRRVMLRELGEDYWNFDVIMPDSTTKRDHGRISAAESSTSSSSTSGTLTTSVSGSCASSSSSRSSLSSSRLVHFYGEVTELLSNRLIKVTDRKHSCYVLTKLLGAEFEARIGDMLKILGQVLNESEWHCYCKFAVDHVVCRPPNTFATAKSANNKDHRLKLPVVVAKISCPANGLNLVEREQGLAWLREYKQLKGVKGV